MSVALELPASAQPADKVPLSFGLVLYPGFQALDVFGPLDALNVLSFLYPIKLYVLAETLDPVSTKSPQGLEHPGSAFSQSIVPTHTFDTAPKVDVLIVPGGVGNRPPNDIGSAIAYIRRVYPEAQYLFTVCTGSGMAAQAGVLDGKKATTNKAAFKRISGYRPQVEWVGKARWVVDGNAWTAAGVSAGIDAIFDFIKVVYGEDVASLIANFMEYERHLDPSWDPYAELHGVQ
ncbi:DJ-1/PfpI family protein [Ephemerocybe angulata]|uniref:DJ-1/PfpI family protein n=1 Tax=Ephemerocybe angulata TaxID=980116 RepID=A0A8H6M2U3_9AGAR|nr:DJ-1/PfpI family protein [Tulosesus angulatus]